MMNGYLREREKVKNVVVTQDISEGVKVTLELIEVKSLRDNISLYCKNIVIATAEWAFR